MKSLRYMLIISMVFLSININAGLSSEQFNIAVVEGALGSEEILNGDYATGLKVLESNDPSSNTIDDKYEISTGICALQILAKEFDSAKPYCDQAIQVYRMKQGENYRYLLSIAYSNRSILRYRIGDIDGANKDISKALSIDKNPVVLSNLKNLKSKLHIDIDDFQDIGA